MRAQSKLVAALELKNLFGLNVLRHTTDRSARRKALLLGIVWFFVILMLIGYIVGLSYGLIYLGMGSILPAYLVTIASLIILMFGLFKAGGTIFHLCGYEILSSLPLKTEAIVAGRFLRMYTEDFLLTLLVLIPGGAVYAAMVRPAWYVYPLWIAAALLIPLLPLAIATLFGTVITALSSRAKNKAAAEVTLSLILVLGIFLGSGALSGSAGDLTPEMLAHLADTVARLLGTIYPPALWLNAAMTAGNTWMLFLCAAVYLAVFAAVVALASRYFHAICRRMRATSAKHDYRMEHQTRSTVLTALWRRELKRYFSSGTYVTNTIMGPVMGTLLAASYLFVGTEGINELLGISLDTGKFLPFLVGGAFTIMPASAVSLSMEGKTWWLTKSLPLSTKAVLDGKLLASLSVIFPFYLTSEILMILALKPAFSDLVWILLIPAVLILFVCVFGITANLMLPKFDWDSEVSVVKQSASAIVGGLSGIHVAVICALTVGLLPAACSHWVQLAETAILLGITVLLRRRNNTADLKKL